MRQALGPGALGKPMGSGWRGRWEGGSGRGTHVNPWLFHSNIWQNSLQIKKKKKLRNRNFAAYHGAMVRNPPANVGEARDVCLVPGSGRPPWGKWLPTPVFLSVKSHGQWSLAGYSPGGHRVRHYWMTKHMHAAYCKSDHHHTKYEYICITI